MAWAGSVLEGADVQSDLSDVSGPPPPDTNTRNAVTQPLDKTEQWNSHKPASHN